jgi:hypothetical protein
MGAALRFALVAFSSTAAPLAATAAGQDAVWPCVQRKVPELSLAQFWTGPELPPDSSAWQKDAAVAALVPALAARRMPLDQAEEQIQAFARSLPRPEVRERMGKLMQGLFDTLDRERSVVISAITGYAGKQLEFAALLRKRASDIAEMENRGDPAANLERERFSMSTRIYDERMQSLTYVCEVPSLIEQRLYALAKLVARATEDASKP